jgi:NAD(P)-dependent dehydrogenase (short-subunit alcohol dehydrogenase family)
MSLVNKVIAISGVAGITGKATARLLLEQGASLAIISSNMSSLDTLAATFTQAEQARVLKVAADLTKADAAQSAAKSVSDKFGGKIDGFIHLVGGWIGGKSIVDSPSSDLEKLLGLHVWSTWHSIQAFLPLLKANKSGRIVAVSHPAASTPVANMAAYETAKAAQETMLFGLNEEVKADGVRVAVIQVHSIYDSGDFAANPSKGAVSAAEIAALIKYLLEEPSAALHGIRIRLDGKV